ncbi:lipoyl protein ligase domain-containing protein [Brevibacillus fulvus]|uniref:Octanoyl-[GcvH]:protein N-octanoyltransferase n=1 Tax=Brevibacillus fulvus TaxID=1125967 RepID=A0A938XU52_9BACL|nr:lipoate--protein ligase family protein [Brevibacillus fulvus]MBM7590528.1 octanoyl-[GcvH]:protein N-octanoyltransferase [Brevibacillus fulvus]
MSFAQPLKFRWMDSGTHTSSPMVPLAFDEAFANQMGLPHACPLIHLWIYDKAFFLGRRDAKLPKLAEALRYYAKLGYGAVLRSSGGACVPLDSGVLNLAIHLPDTTIAIDHFFQLVQQMLTIGLADFGDIRFGEVTGSYCAGEYDFSINGKKIGGMAQRRTRHGSILQLCINVTDQPRGPLMEQFYQFAGLAEMDKNKPIPAIDGSTAGSLQETSPLPFSVEEVKARLFRSLQHAWPIEQVPFSLPLQAFEQARAHLQERLGLFAFQADEMTGADWSLALR